MLMGKFACRISLIQDHVDCLAISVNDGSFGSYVKDHYWISLTTVILLDAR